jgi:hypothetical protein
VDKLEEAKKLLKNAIATNDAELIALANNLLEQENNVKSAEDKTKNVITADDADFLSPIIQKGSIEMKKGGTPVNEITNRSNSFHDDGTESKDIVTPSFQPTDRKRKAYKPIEQTCTRCNKVVTVNPTHKREFFVCDKCLGK